MVVVVVGGGGVLCLRGFICNVSRVLCYFGMCFSLVVFSFIRLSVPIFFFISSNTFFLFFATCLRFFVTFWQIFHSLSLVRTSFLFNFFLCFSFSLIFFTILCHNIMILVFLFNNSS